jgi:hypothetical protein
MALITSGPTALGNGFSYPMRVQRATMGLHGM